MQNDYWINKLPITLGLIIGLLGAISFYLLSTEAYSHGPSSVGSSFGFLLTIILTPIIAILGYCIGASIGYLILVILKKREFSSFKTILSAFIVIAFFSLSTLPFINYVRTSYEIKQINYHLMSNLDLLNSVTKFTTYPADYRAFIYAAIVTNENADDAVFNKILSLNDPVLQENMWSIGGLMGENKKGYSVYRLIAQNPKSSVQTLKKLSESKDYFVLEDVARNSKTPIDILREIHKNDPKVYLGFIYNKNTPSDILLDIANTTPDYLRNGSLFVKLLEHPNFPTDMKKKFKENN